MFEGLGDSGAGVRALRTSLHVRPREAGTNTGYLLITVP